jgi:hypothetical protein
MPAAGGHLLLGDALTGLLTAAVAAASLALALLLGLAHRRSHDIKEWLVGAAGGLDFAQVAHVHLFTIAVALWLLTDRAPALRRMSVGTVALLGAAALLGATAFVGPLTLTHTLSLQLMALACSAAVVAVKATPRAVGNIARGLLAVCLLSACWAILQKAGLLPIHRFNAVEGTSRPMGIYREPDWLGLFCAVGIVVTLRLELSTRRKVAFLSILAMALLVSLARASVIALGAIALASLVGSLLSGSRPSARQRRNRQALLALAGVVVVVLALTPSLSGRLLTRFQSAFTNTEQDVGARSRSLQVQTLESLAHGSPWYGDGFSASGRVQVTGGVSYGDASSSRSRAVATDWILGWWVDGKYLALPLILMLCLLALRRSRRLGGQLLIVVLVTSLVTDAVMLPIAWLSIGLCLAGAEPRERQRGAGAWLPGGAHAWASG